MNSSDNIDITALAKQAHAAGYDSPERVVARLERIVARNTAYINKPYRQGRAYNEIVEEDTKAIARAIVFIESLQGRDDAWLRRIVERAVRYAMKFSENCDEQAIREIVDEIIEGRDK